MPRVSRQKVIKQDLGEVWHTFCVRIIKKNEMARYKVGFSGPHTLRTVSAEFICLPHLHGGPEEIPVPDFQLFNKSPGLGQIIRMIATHWPLHKAVQHYLHLGVTLLHSHPGG